MVFKRKLNPVLKWLKKEDDSWDTQVALTLLTNVQGDEVDFWDTFYDHFTFEIEQVLQKGGC